MFTKTDKYLYVLLIVNYLTIVSITHAMMPFRTNDACLTKGNGFQIDVGTCFDKFSDKKVLSIYTDTRKGILKFINFTNYTPIVFSFKDGKVEKGVGDITIGLKLGRPYRVGILKGRREFYASLNLRVRTPTGDEKKGLGLPGYDFIPGLSTSICTERIGFDGSFDFRWTSDRVLRNSIEFGTDFGLLVWGDDTTGFLVNGEVYGSSNKGVNQDRWEMVSAVGGTFAISRGWSSMIPMILTIGGTVGLGLTDDSPEWTINMGISFGFLWF